MGTTTASDDTMSSQRARLGWRGAMRKAVSAALVSRPAASRMGPITVNAAVPVAMPAAVSGVPMTTSSPAAALMRLRRTLYASADIKVAAKPA